MKVRQILETNLGTEPKREKRVGSRPARGHKEEPRYKKTGISKDKEDQFHLKLDKLVHGTFGNSPDEVSEGVDERKQNALWAQITQHEKQAKATKNDIKKQHHMKMASDLRSQLKTSDLDEADKHSMIGKIQRHRELKKKVDTSFDDIGKAQKDGDHTTARKAFRDHERYANLERPETWTKVDEGEVIAFPKKHKGDLADTHDCPKCGGDLQGGKYMGHQVKVCMPCKQVYLPPNSGIDKHGNKMDEIAGAFPSPSTRAQWAKDAAASNAAEAKRQAELKAKADAQRLQQNTELVDKEQKVNHHSLDATIPSNEGWFDSKPAAPKVDWNQRAKAMFAQGMNEQQVAQQLAKEGCPPAQIPVYVQAGQMNEGKTVKKEPQKPRNFVAKNAINTGAGAHKDKKKAEKQGDTKHKKNPIDMAETMDYIGSQLPMMEKASRQLCKSSKPDEDLGASNLASCKSQGLRARDGEKSHLIGHGNSEVRIKVGGKRIKGKKYGGPLPDYGTRKGQ